MKFSKLIVTAGFAVAASGAFAETGVNTADLGYVANVYGRASIPAVKIAGPLVTRPADVNVAGREAAQGTTPTVVTTKEVDVNEVFGRT
ncbi:MAG TPA: hypothetical protein VGQ19_01785 [Burkholderiales bacterium]|jgi:hypothetical protein|nr:hypothetical protein [Burkholderiales bacterium]